MYFDDTKSRMEWKRKLSTTYYAYTCVYNAPPPIHLTSIRKVRIAFYMTRQNAHIPKPIPITYILIYN